ncbi:hypothetical protein CY34DRAFT_187549 [Suillus luteus UH-Slu-Lm8-n1]|uniref:Uncharacterized protein n=1 Tax=Suillus luteus UH-Slu-Lm8-n1 TaxID=930992 RepID=A0A0D0BEM3_9AGAM|nr:hypothetical protein CY34DRAFT_187549 [Suillus luteus UH-Slu-Lm8-n1]
MRIKVEGKGNAGRRRRRIYPPMRRVTQLQLWQDQRNAENINSRWREITIIVSKSNQTNQQSELPAVRTTSRRLLWFSTFTIPHNPFHIFC